MSGGGGSPGPHRFRASRRPWSRVAAERTVHHRSFAACAYRGDAYERTVARHHVSLSMSSDQPTGAIKCLTRVHRGRVELVQLTDLVDDRTGGRIWGDPLRELLQRLTRLNLNHCQPAGHRRGRVRRVDRPNELRHQPEPHGDGRGDHCEHDRGQRCYWPTAVRGARHQHTGTAERGSRSGRPVRAVFDGGRHGGAARDGQRGQWGFHG